MAPTILEEYMANHKRLLTNYEKKLLELMQKNIFPQYSNLNLHFSKYVSTLDDGKMGSFSFIYDDEQELENLNILPIGEYQFIDIDGVPVLITLYAYDNGKLYELDIWKSNFEPLLSYPIDTV